MAVDFPSTPFIGQAHYDGNTVWTWDGLAWVVRRPTSVGPVYETVADLQATGDTFGDGTVITTRAEGFAYVADSTLAASQLPTASATKLRLLPTAHGFNVLSAGAAGDGVTDDTDAFKVAVEEADGRAVFVPGGKTYVISDTLSNNDAASFGAFAPGIRLIGDATLTAYLDNRVANAPMIDIDSARQGGSYEASWGSEIRNLSIINTTSPANSVAIRVLNGYQIKLDHLYIKGMTAYGIELKNGLYADDGWNMIDITNTWIDGCKVWGMKADGSDGRNEGSYTNLQHVFFQSNGTDHAYGIVGITQTNPCVVSIPSNPFENGDEVVFYGVGGMTEINTLTGVVQNKSGNQMEIAGLDTTGFSGYGSGGVCTYNSPRSGGMIWKGQQLALDQVAFANGNRNVGLYIKGGSGLGLNAYLRSTTFENGYTRQFLCEGITQLKIDQSDFKNNDDFVAYTQCELNGTNSVIQNVDIGGSAVRATAGNDAITAFKVYGNNAQLQQISIDQTTWENFDYAGQTRYDGFKDRPVMLARKASAQSVFSSPSDIVFDVVDEDEQATYDPVLGRVRIYYPDVFTVKGRLTLSSLDAGAEVVISLYNHSTTSYEHEIKHIAYGAASQSFPYDFTVLLGTLGTQRDYSIRAQQNTAAGSRPLDVSDSAYNTMSVLRINTYK